MRRAILTCKILLMVSIVSTIVSCRDAKTEATTEQTDGLEKVVDNTEENGSSAVEKMESEAEGGIEEIQEEVGKIEAEAKEVIKEAEGGIDNTKAAIEEKAKGLKTQIEKGS